MVPKQALVDDACPYRPGLILWQLSHWEDRLDIDDRHRRHLRYVVIVVIVVMRRHVSLCRHASRVLCRYCRHVSLCRYVVMPLCRYCRYCRYASSRVVRCRQVSLLSLLSLSSSSPFCHCAGRSAVALGTPPDVQLSFWASVLGPCCSGPPWRARFYEV
jgi:hypothetical protein